MSVSHTALVPSSSPFLGASKSSQPAAIVLGAPLDLTESFRSGTAGGPGRIRQVSEVLETYSPTLGVDLRDLPVADWGDVPLDGCDMEEALQRIANTAEAASRSALLVLLGGEHTITVGAVRGVLRRYPALQVVHIDAHADLRDEYEGLRLSHATVMRRVVDEIGLSRVAQYGVRSGTREELDLARKCLYSGRDLLLTRPVRDRIHTRPVYVSIDIDVLDPSCAPGTGCPEPGGASFSELLSFLHSLRDLNVVAVDITEVLPAADVNDITSIAAAKLAREAALAFGKR